MSEHGRRVGAARGPLTIGRGGGALRLAVAIVASVALILSAPAIGSARSALRAAFPGTFSRLIEGGLAIVLLGAVVVALARIRTARVRRYGALAAALAIAWAYSAATGSADPAIRAVERVHFVEFGLIAWLFLRVWRDRPDASAIVAPALAAFVAGIGDEAFQWFLPARVGELADVALNAVAIGCGVLAGAACTPPADLTGRWRGGSIRLVTRLIALAIAAGAAFVHVVHLGHRIDVPEVGSFLSRETGPRLDVLARDRAATWAAAPPLVRPPRFSREDQFMTEGLQHVQARNEAWAGGAVATAWHENAILERYFAPVLDTPSYVSRTGHRWSPEQRADAERRARRGLPLPFASRAFPYPIFTLSPLVLWAVAIVAALGIWLAGSRAAARERLAGD